MLENNIKLNEKVVTGNFHSLYKIHNGNLIELKPTVSQQIDNYLNHITNLDDYSVHISRIIDNGIMLGYVTLIKRPIFPKHLQKELDTIKRYADIASW